MTELVENYLVKVNEEHLQEDPLSVALIYGSISVAINLTMVLTSTYIMMKSFKDNKKLSKKLNDVLGTTNWKVKIMKEKMPNAMVIGPKAVFLTTGLIDLMNPRELMSIMLHEVYHVKDWHIQKQLAVQYPLFYIVIFIMASGVAFPMGPLILLNMLIFNIMINALMIPYKITIGRKHEKDADAYSIKFGYGKDMISALNKLESFYKKAMKDQKCGSVCKAIEKINEAIDEHPSIRKRVEHILKQSDLFKKVMSGKFKVVKDYILTGLGVDKEKQIEKGKK